MNQAQADQQAEHMRKMVEEKKRQRQLAAEQQLAHDDEGAPQMWAEPRGKEVGPRQKWVEPQEPLQLAQQPDVTATLGEGESLQNVLGLHSPNFYPETSSVIVFERPSAPVIKGVNEPAVPVQQGAEPRRQWGEGGGTPVISLLKNRELEAETGVWAGVGAFM